MSKKGNLDDKNVWIQYFWGNKNVKRTKEKDSRDGRGFVETIVQNEWIRVRPQYLRPQI
jgi:predicted nucleic acid-binding protein